MSYFNPKVSNQWLKSWTGLQIWFISSIVTKTLSQPLKIKKRCYERNQGSHLHPHRENVQSLTCWATMWTPKTLMRLAQNLFHMFYKVPPSPHSEREGREGEWKGFCPHDPFWLWDSVASQVFLGSFENPWTPVLSRMGSVLLLLQYSCQNSRVMRKRKTP